MLKNQGVSLILPKDPCGVNIAERQRLAHAIGIAFLSLSFLCGLPPRYTRFSLYFEREAFVIQWVGSTEPLRC